MGGPRVGRAASFRGGSADAGSEALRYPRAVARTILAMMLEVWPEVAKWRERRSWR